jgi:hypothetical protein
MVTKKHKKARKGKVLPVLEKYLKFAICQEKIIQWQNFYSSLTPSHYETGSVIFVKMP